MGHKEVVEVNKEVYNLVGETYHTWDATGELVDLTTFHFALPRFLKDKIVYIVGRNVYNKAKQAGRDTNDLVYAEDYGKTSDGTDLVKLLLYDDKNTRVYPIKGA